MTKKELTVLEVLHDDIQDIKKDVKSLIHFKGWVLGAACAAGVIGGLLSRLIEY